MGVPAERWEICPERATLRKREGLQDWRDGTTPRARVPDQNTVLPWGPVTVGSTAP